MPSRGVHPYGPQDRHPGLRQPLRESGFAISASRGPITGDAWHRIRAWRDEWIRLGAAVPVLVADGAPPLTGEAALCGLEEEIARTGAVLDPALGDPARYPTAATRPSKEWVSQIGDLWSHVWKAGV